MAIARFMHYFNYKLEEVLDMFAVSFYALLSQMYRLEAEHNLGDVRKYAVAHTGGEPYKNYIDEMDTQMQGASYYLKQSQVIKRAKNVN